MLYILEFEIYKIKSNFTKELILKNLHSNHKIVFNLVATVIITTPNKYINKLSLFLYINLKKSYICQNLYLLLTLL